MAIDQDKKKEPSESGNACAPAIERGDLPIATFKCKAFDYIAEKLTGFTAKQLVDFEESEDYSAIEDLFAKIDYTTVWNLVLKIEENNFNKKNKFYEAKIVSCDPQK
jgi:hypothetical protein